MFLLAACGGDDGGGGGSGGDADLEKWIPTEVNGKKLERKEVTVPETGEGATTTTAPAGEDANKNTSQLGQSLAGSVPKVEGIAVGEIPSSGENAFGQEMPTLFVGAIESSEGAEAIQKSLGQSATGAKQEQVKVDGIDVTVITFDMAAQLQGQQLPEGTPPLPTITIQFFSPEKDVVVVVFSTESRELADAATKASIESGK